MRGNELSDGFASGFSLASNFMHQREAEKLQKERQDLELALANLKTGGGVGRINRHEGPNGEQVADAIPLSPSEQEAFTAGKPLGSLQFVGDTYINPGAADLAEQQDRANKLADQKALIEAHFHNTVAGKQIDLDNEIRRLHESATIAEKAGDQKSKQDLENRLTILREQQNFLSGARGSAADRLEHSRIKERYALAMKDYKANPDDPAVQAELEDAKGEYTKSIAAGAGDDLLQQQSRVGARAEQIKQDNEYQQKLGEYNDARKKYDSSWFKVFKTEPVPPTRPGATPVNTPIASVPPGYNSEAGTVPDASTPTVATSVPTPAAPSQSTALGSDAKAQLDARLGMNQGVTITGEDIAHGLKTAASLPKAALKAVYDRTGRPVAEAIGAEYANAFPEQSELDYANKLHRDLQSAGVDTSAADDAYRRMNGQGEYYPGQPIPPNTPRGYIDVVNKLAEKNTKPLVAYANLQRKRAVDTTAAANAIKADYQSGKLSKDDARAALLKIGFKQ